MIHVLYSIASAVGLIVAGFGLGWLAGHLLFDDDQPENVQ